MSSKKFATLTGGSKMPLVGLGTWQAKDATELETALNTALEIGYRHIDTAFVYENEAIIGNVLKKWFDSGKLQREDLFITTKLPMYGVHPDRVELFMKKSLKNLQLDYVDLYLVHFAVCGQITPEGTLKMNEQGEIETEITDHIAVWEKMEEQVDLGRAKAIGLSNFNTNQIDKILKNSRIKPAVLQVELHVYLQQRELVKFCQENNIIVEAYSPLGSPGINKFLEGLGKPPKKLPDMLNDSVVKKIAEKHKRTNAQILLKYLLQKDIVVIPKSVTPARLRENIDVFDFNLDGDDMKALNNLEVGESARVCDFKAFPGLEKNAEWPFVRS